MMRVAEIRLYPVKGLRGFAVREAMVEPWGLAGDRRFMVVDGASRFMTQREWPAMAVVAADIVSGGLALSTGSGQDIRIQVPDATQPRVEVTIWKNRVPAVDCGQKIAVWLSDVLGTPCRLVHMSEPATARPADPDFAAPADHVSFADGFPLLVTTQASLDDLNARLDRPVTMDRFRTNLLVEGAEPWAEDDWRSLRVGEVRFAGVKDCARCAVTTVDQESGVRSGDNEPLRTLAGFRRKAGGRIIFGQNLVPRRLGRVVVGDTVESFGESQPL